MSCFYSSFSVLSASFIIFVACRQMPEIFDPFCFIFFTLSLILTFHKWITVRSCKCTLQYVLICRDQLHQNMMVAVGQEVELLAIRRSVVRSLVPAGYVWKCPCKYAVSLQSIYHIFSCLRGLVFSAFLTLIHTVTRCSLAACQWQTFVKCDSVSHLSGFDKKRLPVVMQ